MDLLKLGSQSRKTGIRARQNLRKDKYDMEDVDDFFTDEEDAPDNRRRLKKHSGGQALTPKGNFNNVARKINFTDAEAESYNLSPISLTSTYPPKKKNKKSPLRSPLPEHKKQRQLLVDTDEYSEEYNMGEDYDNDLFEDDYVQPKDRSLSPVSLSPVIRNNSRKSASSLTRQMALGSTSKRNMQSIRESSDESVDSDGVNELPSPPPTTKKQKERKPKPTRSKLIKPSPLPSPPPDGVRRGKRFRIPPVAFWRNEKVEYGPVHVEDRDADTTIANLVRNVPLQEIKNVIAPPATLTPPVKKTSRLTSRSRHSAATKKKRARKQTYDYESDPEISGSEWFGKNSLEAEVFENEDKVKRVVAYAPEAGEFKDGPFNPDQPEESFKIAYLFNHHNDFSASAILEFPLDGVKMVKSSGSNLMSFHVIKGLIEVTLNRAKFVVTRGCSFEVPPGNIYGFKNLGQDPAKLYLVQTRDPELVED